MNWVRRGCVMGFCVVMAGGPSLGWALSPVNLNQGYPTQLDDAYPVPKGSVVIQTGIRTDVFEVASGVERGRVRSIHDLRVGIGERSEFTVGAIGFTGTRQPGSLEDPASINVGLMTQVFRPGEEASLLPTVAMRVTAGVPRSGGHQYSTLQASLLGSWKGPQDWWMSSNAWYGLVPGYEVGHWAQGRTHLWGVAVGAVKAWSPSMAMVLNVNVYQDPLLAPSEGQSQLIVNPELGLIWAPYKDLHLSIGGGRDLFGVQGQSILRGTIGVTYVF